MKYIVSSLWSTNIYLVHYGQLTYEIYISLNIPTNLHFDMPEGEQTYINPLDSREALHRHGKVHAFVRENLNNASEKIKQLHDVSCRQSFMRVDESMVYNTRTARGRSPKLDKPWWEGLFT